MYVPKQFSLTDTAEIISFIEKNSFGILVSCKDATPIATHIPLDVVRNNDGSFYLFTHISKANEQSRLLKEHSNVLAIFSSYHNYISSSWYDHENVPTWNYMAIHITGTTEIVEGEALLPFLAMQMNKYERQSEKPLKLTDISNEYIASHLKGIIGIKIHINKIDAAYKLSQNRDDKNYRLIIDELQKLNTENSVGIADAMKKMRKEH